MCSGRLCRFDSTLARMDARGARDLSGDAMLIRGLTALVLVSATTPAALAECRYMGLRFHFSQNESVATTGVSTKRGACSTRFWSSGTARYSSAVIASRPSHGTLTQSGTLSFRYKPAAGFKGVDRYSLRVCGMDDAGSGCATLTYNITVE